MAFATSATWLIRHCTDAKVHAIQQVLAVIFQFPYHLLISPDIYFKTLFEWLSPA